MTESSECMPQGSGTQKSVSPQGIEQKQFQSVDDVALART